MPTDLKPSEREDLRNVVLGYLAARQTGAFDAAQIRATLLRRRDLDFAPTVADVEAAVSFLLDKGFAKLQPSDMGAYTPSQATSAGVAEAERRGLC